MAVFVRGLHGGEAVVRDAVIKAFHFRRRDGGIFGDALLDSFRNHLITNNFPHIFLDFVHRFVVGILNDFGVAADLREPIVDLVGHACVHLLIGDDDTIDFGLVLVKFLFYKLFKDKAPRLLVVVHRVELGGVVRIFHFEVGTHDDFLSDDSNNFINGGLGP